MDNRLIFHPIISSIQKIILYETKTKFYLVGTNNTQTRFRVLKIDRMEPRELLIHDDKVEYTKNEIHNLVNMIDSGNRQKSGSGFSNITSAFGIVGFIRFLEGYYIILVTKRRKAAVIGYHTIYKIECTSMIYIPQDSVRLLHPDEPRYYKMFQGIDLSSNFYFSYSYDVTHTLQHNMSPPNRIIPNHISNDSDCSDDLTDLTDNQLRNDPPLFPINQSSTHSKGEQQQQQQEYGVRAKPHGRFVWNAHLIRPVKKLLHPDWILYVVHGFVGQANVSVFGRPVYVTLLARRSSRYAGTRFLKRGANSRGDVANEVETEQIVHDSHVSALHRSRIASFVQLRGSIPGQWRQDMGRVVTKPAITIDLHDPLAEVAGAHFTDLLKRYGGPIVVLNLVKRHEHKAQERLLSDELLSAIRYLTQFLPQGAQGTGQTAPLQYKAFDMARKNKSSAADVMGQLAGIAKAAVNKTGFFCNKRNSYDKSAAAATVHLQTGVVRTNCVDCLDRTNTAQFALGRCALGAQLLALGLMATPNGSSVATLLPFDCDCVRMLESLYEDHGDTLALQYGGSQLVHRVRTYRKTAPWTSHGNDIMQTLSRYYSNTFSDADKQCSMNLFLGLYECTNFTSGISSSAGNVAIWDLPSDYYLHHIPRPLSNMAVNYRTTGQSLWAALGLNNTYQIGQYQLPLDTQQKAACELIRVLDGAAGGAEMVDSFADYHRPYELTSLTDHYAYQLDHSVRDYMPCGTLDYNPFRVRVRPGRRREQQNSGTQSTTAGTTNPSLSGLSSNSSAASSNSSSTDNEENSESSTLDCQELFDQNIKLNTIGVSNAKSTFELFPSFEIMYGIPLNKEINRNDMILYKKYVLMGRRATNTQLENSGTNINNNFNSPIFNNSKEQFNSTDNSCSVNVPVIQTEALNMYNLYVNTGLHGGTDPDVKDLKLYRKCIDTW